jgi:peptidoglycan/xylan/chitin deacetylase (PgdA/CDA1 family)
VDLSTTGFILTFHSQNISGNTYGTNDHVALDESLALIKALRLPVLPLIDVVRKLRSGTISSLPRRFVCLTFDDGPDYDWKVVRHTVHGVQEPMIRVLQRHSIGLFGRAWIRKSVATSFVIASPKAREEISGPDNPDRMSDDWWAAAQSSGFLDIGVHSWNHVHPSVKEMRTFPELVEAFGNVATTEQADLQVAAAVKYIRERAGGASARLFAYPYGHVSDFLAGHYLPAQDDVLAAFTTEGRPLEAGSDIWRLPRYVCGWHWKSNEELRAVLSS